MGEPRGPRPARPAPQNAGRGAQSHAVLQCGGWSPGARCQQARCLVWSATSPPGAQVADSSASSSHKHRDPAMGPGLMTPPNPWLPEAAAPAPPTSGAELRRSNVGGRLQQGSKGERGSEPTQSAPSRGPGWGGPRDASAPDSPGAAALTFVLLLVLQVLPVQHVEQPQHWRGEHHQVLDVRGWRHSATRLEAPPSPGGPGRGAWHCAWFRCPSGLSSDPGETEPWATYRTEC